MAKVIWQPQPKQIEFMQRPEYECLYGGAAGGGKSDALLIEALRQVDVPNYRGLIFRRTFPQLEGLISRSLDLYPKIYPSARYSATEKRWRFKSGANIFFGQMQYEADKYNWQGKPYDFIGFDELTHFTYTQYMYLMSRNRPTGANTRVYMRATANPGGVGHSWVKQRFITAAPPMTPIENVYHIQTPEHKTIEVRKRRIFVPATVFDNKALLDNDPEYIGTLAALPEAERNSLLYGDWNAFSGQVFSEWMNDPNHYVDGKFTHVIEGFRVPYNWTIVRCYDFGYTHPYAVVWLAIDEEKKAYIINEYYGWNGTPNTGSKDPIPVQAKEILRIEDEDENIRGRNIIGIADPSIWDSSRGESVARQFENFGVYFQRGKNDRLNGKQQFHSRMMFDENGECQFQVFKKCKNVIRTLPALVYDERKTEDIDTEGEDHIYDSIRYGLMEFIVAPKIAEEKPYLGINPLEL